MKNVHLSLRYLRYLVTWQLRGWRKPGRSPISFSQVAEDLVVERLIGPVRSFVDIGANDGVTCSNTARFALQGGRGLVFEPQPATFRRLAAYYRFSPRIHCLNAAVSDHVTALTMSGEGLHARIGPAGATGAVAMVSGAPLQTWLDKMPEFSRPDVCTIDVEGHELAVLRGAGFPSFRPRCIVIETHGGTHPDQTEIDAILHRHCFRELLRNHLNSFYFPSDATLNAPIDSIPATFARYSLPERA